ncbi:MAG: DUF4974 domain-containing protein [Rikenellaceae bacterium]|nr:DUF4974 domain-containing protein [Rikenellaceae bacterium]MCL2692282.1 DUF4974 domain-containing protein [Rikenellaceae bacterium]
MKEAFRIAEIIQKSLDGAVSSAERQQLDEWLAADERHRTMYGQMQREGYLDERLAEHAQFSIERGYRRFRRSVRSTQRAVLRRVAAAAVVALAVGGGLWMMQRGGEADSLMMQARPGTTGAVLTLADGRHIELTDAVNTDMQVGAAHITIQDGMVSYVAGNAEADIVHHTLTTPRGGEHRLTMADGTAVWVNAASEMRYPARFGNDGLREVWLDGEAYFEVAQDATRPFIVHTGGMTIRVTGTAFNVRAYPGEAQQATLVEGSVEIHAGGRDYRLLPGSRLDVGEDGVEIRRVNVRNYEAWKHERFIFDDELLEDVARKLERWYDVSIVVDEPAVRQLRFTGNMPKYESLQTVLRKLELTTSIRFEARRGVIHVINEGNS